MKKLILCLAVLVAMLPSWAQRDAVQRYVTIQMVADKADRTYKTGEDPTITVAVIKDSYPQKNVEVQYSWGEELLTPEVKAKLNTADGYKALKLKGMKKPGFKTLTAKVTIDGIEYTNFTNVGFEPEKIVPTTKMPEDFSQFWTKVLESSSKVPLESTMTLQPNLCTPWADVYHVRFQNSAPGQYIYGMLSMPKDKSRKYPAVLIVPGAGVRAYFGETEYAKQGVISLQIGIHGIPVNLPDELYLNLRANALSNYNSYNYDNRDTYYYKKVYAGCVKAVDFLCSLPEVDSSRLGVGGGSQGGLLALVTAALDPRIKSLYSNYPAMSNISGFHYGTTGGWPRLFRNPSEVGLEAKIKVSEYYDAVNFARLLKQPVHYGVSYNDQTCPPTSTYAAYNVITAPKTPALTLDAGHWRYGEHNEAQRAWLIEMIKK